MEVILLVMIGTFIGFILIAFIRKPPAYMPMRGHGHPEADAVDLIQLESLSMADFEAMLRRFVDEHIGLTIDVVDYTSPREIEIRARDPKPMVGGMYIVHGILRPQDDYVGPEQVMALRDVCKEEGAIKGFLVTNGTFAAPAAQMLEAQKLELINGARLLEFVGQPRSA